MSDLEDHSEPSPSDQRSSRRFPLLVVLACVLLLAGVAIIGNVVVAQENDDGSDRTAGPTTSSPVSEPAPDTITNTASTPSTSSTSSSTSPPSEGSEGSEEAEEAEGSSIELNLNDFTFEASGVVPNEDSANAITAAVLNTYGEFGKVDLTIDPEAEIEPWLEQMPFVVQNFARILDGSLSIDNGGTTISGRSPNQASIDFLTDALSPNNGFPELTDDGMQVVNLRQPELTADSTDGVVTLTGVVPSAALKDTIVSGAVDAYGEDNVIVELDVDDGTFARFDLVRFANNIALFKGTENFEVGVRDGSFYAVLEDGIAFAVASTALSAEAERLLARFPELINQNTLEVKITGHTDDIGSETDNLALSERRAGRVAEYLTSLGVDPSRLVVFGAGEFEPIAPNSTVEGRALNRRVVISMGFDE